MNKIISGVLYRFGRIILLFFIVIISLSSFCTNKPNNYLEPINVSNSSGRSENPSIAVDSSNTVHLVWNDDTPGNEEIFYATKFANDTWSEPVQVTHNAGASRFPYIVIDKNDKIHLVWQQIVVRGGSSHWEIFYSWRFSGDTWTIPETISIYGASNRPVLAIDNDLGLHLFWMEGMSPEVCHHYYAYKAQGGQWEIRFLFTSSISEYNMKVDQGKGVHIAIQIKSEIYYLEKKPNGVWRDTVQISEPPLGHSVHPDIDINQNGSLHIVWVEYDTMSYGPVYLQKTEQGNWLPIENPYTDTIRNYSLGVPVGLKIVTGKGGKFYILMPTDNPLHIYYGGKKERWEPLKLIVKNYSHLNTVAIDASGNVYCALSEYTQVYPYSPEVYYFEFTP